VKHPKAKPKRPRPGLYLAIERKRLGLSQAQAAKRAGVSQPTWAAVETDYDRATLDRLHQFATAIGADPHAIDPRLASTAHAQAVKDEGPRTLTLLTQGHPPDSFVGETPADDALVVELAPAPALLDARRALGRLIHGASSAGVRVVIRTDLRPAPADAP
jgi:transcriptional regulator with XRE-family HTH domain